MTHSLSISVYLTLTDVPCADVDMISLFHHGHSRNFLYRSWSPSKCRKRMQGPVNGRLTVKIFFHPFYPVLHMFFMNVCVCVAVWAMYVYKCILLFFFLYLQLPEPFFVLCCHLARQRIKNIKKERHTHSTRFLIMSAAHCRFAFVYAIVCVCVSCNVCIAISQTNTLNKKATAKIFINKN